MGVTGAGARQWVSKLLFKHGGIDEREDLVASQFWPK